MTAAVTVAIATAAVTAAVTAIVVTIVAILDGSGRRSIIITILDGACIRRALCGQRQRQSRRQGKFLEQLHLNNPLLTFVNGLFHFEPGRPRFLWIARGVAVSAPVALRGGIGRLSSVGRAPDL
jgi:hypothetical protein